MVVAIVSRKAKAVRLWSFRGEGGDRDREPKSLAVQSDGCVIDGCSAEYGMVRPGGIWNRTLKVNHLHCCGVHQHSTRGARLDRGARRLC